MNPTKIKEMAGLWQKLVESHHAFNKAKVEFFSDQEGRIETLRKGLLGRDKETALDLARFLSLEEQKKLLDAWVHLARCVHGPFEPAWNIILSLPRDWVLANIEKEADQILEKEEEDDYWMFLQLYFQLGRELFLKLLGRVSAHPNPVIRELAENYPGKVSEEIPINK